MRLLPMLALSLLLTACGGSDTDPSGATESEARQLNEAAAMLKDDSVSTNAISAEQGNLENGNVE